MNPNAKCFRAPPLYNGTTTTTPAVITRPAAETTTTKNTRAAVVNVDTTLTALATEFFPSATAAAAVVAGNSGDGHRHNNNNKALLAKEFIPAAAGCGGAGEAEKLSIAAAEFIPFLLGGRVSGMALSAGAAWDNDDRPKNRAVVGTVQKNNLVVCRFFSKGACRKGLECPFLHDNSSSSSSIAGSTTTTTIPPVPATSSAATDPEIFVDVVDKTKNPTAEILLVEGVLCCFGPGGKVVRLDLGSSSSDNDADGPSPGGGGSTVVVSGLPKESVTHQDIETCLSKAGPLQQIKVKDSSSSDQSSTKYVVATYVGPEAAARAVLDLNGSPVKDWIGGNSVLAAVGRRGRRGVPPPSERDIIATGVVSVQFAGQQRARQNQMAGVSVRVHWYAPSKCAWLHFPDKWRAQKAATKLHGQTLLGREISTKYQKPTLHQNCNFSVWVGGLSDKTQKVALKQFVERIAHFHVESVTMNEAPYIEDEGPRIIQRLLHRFGTMVAFEVQQQPTVAASRCNNDNLKRRALARYCTEEEAQSAYAYFRQHSKVKELGGTALHVNRLFTVKYNVPRQVFAAIRSMVDAKLKNMESSSSVRYKVFENSNTRADTCTFSINADDRETIESVRTGIGPMVDGVVVRDVKLGNRALWNRQMRTPQFQADCDCLVAKLGRCAWWIDERRQVLRVFGAEKEQKGLIDGILGIVEASRMETHGAPINRTDFELILMQGRIALDKIALACGSTKVSLNIGSQSLLVEGTATMARKASTYAARLSKGEEALHDLGSASLCPVCFCPPGDEDNILTKAVKLDCGHVYCNDCVASWLCVNNTRDFPLLCLRQDCSVPVSLTDLQRLLDSTTFLGILRNALDTHVRKNPLTLQFCLKPTCPGLFEITPDCRVSYCSTCNVDICTACQACHGSRSCADYRLATAPPDLFRMKVVDEILTLRCPRCSQAFLDFSGCFALKCDVCSCGFCGWCLQDCGADAHSHVLVCAGRPAGHTGYFGEFKQFEAAQNQTRLSKLQDRLRGMADGDRKVAIASIQGDLADLGVSLS